MGEQRSKFTREFKLEAARLVVEGGHSVALVARDLDLSEGAFPGMGAASATR